MYKNVGGNTPLDESTNSGHWELSWYITNHLWFRCRPLVVTRPHYDYETKEDFRVTSLGEFVTTKGGNDPRSQDYALSQLKIKIASFSEIKHYLNEKKTNGTY